MRIVTKRLRLDLRDFHYKLALHLSYPHIKFDDEIRRDSLLISRIISDYPVVCRPYHVCIVRNNCK